MVHAASLFALEPAPEPVQAAPGPAEKVLQWAQDLDLHREDLEREAARVERLLDSLTEPVTSAGNELMAQFVGVLEAQLDGICGLLDYDLTGDEELLQSSLQCLLSSDAELQSLEQRLSATREALPLVA